LRPRSRWAVTASGTNMLTSDGSHSALMMPRLVTCPPIHSIVVVTSPIGDQAPPELAEITMMPARNSRSWCLSSSLRSNDTITMVVVRLSRIALSTKVTIAISNMRLDSLVVLMREVITSKPLCASTTSTMAMAPIRKNTICAVAVSDSPSCSVSA